MGLLKLTNILKCYHIEVAYPKLQIFPEVPVKENLDVVIWHFMKLITWRIHTMNALSLPSLTRKLT